MTTQLWLINIIIIIILQHSTTKFYCVSATSYIFRIYFIENSGDVPSKSYYVSM